MELSYEDAKALAFLLAWALLIGYFLYQMFAYEYCWVDSLETHFRRSKLTGKWHSKLNRYSNDHTGHRSKSKMRWKRISIEEVKRYL